MTCSGFTGIETTFEMAPTSFVFIHSHIDGFRDFWRFSSDFWHFSSDFLDFSSDSLEELGHGS